MNSIQHYSDPDKERKHLVNGYDAERVLNASKQIQKKFEIHGPLGGFLEDIRLLLAVVKDFTIGRYRKARILPWPRSWLQRTGMRPV